jgi:hypothetical protein
LGSRVTLNQETVTVDHVCRLPAASDLFLIAPLVIGAQDVPATAQQPHSSPNALAELETVNRVFGDSASPFGC